MIPQQGDYERRHTTLWALFRPPEEVSWDALRAEMRAGVAAIVPEWAGTGYAILWAYAKTRGVILGEPDGDLLTPGHPLLYLQGALRIQGSVGHWPPLVIRAFEEFQHEKVLTVLSYPKGWTAEENRSGSGRQGHSQAPVRGADKGRRGTLRLKF